MLLTLGGVLETLGLTLNMLVREGDPESLSPEAEGFPAIPVFFFVVVFFFLTNLSVLCVLL